MKIKCRPEDFRVEEIIKLKIKRRGPYSIYRLEKRLWNTLDVIRQVQTRYHLRGFSRAGLKDRYSHSVQYLSLLGRGPEKIQAANYSLTLIGMADQPITHALLLGNKFEITLRNLGPQEVVVIKRSLSEIEGFGIANYYDEQRFGSARHRQGFIARKLIDGHYNGALKLFLATPGPGDNSRVKERKRALLANWGDWQKCLDFVPFEGRAAIKHLVVQPKDFEGAIRLLPKVFLELFINAYQSWLWNETLRQLLIDLDLTDYQINYHLGRMVFYRDLTKKDWYFLKELTIPAPSPKAEFTSERVARAMQVVMENQGMELKDLKLKFRIKGLFFKPFLRRAIFQPQQMKMENVEPDDLYPGKYKLKLIFILPAGSYATVLLKRLKVK